MANNKAEKKEVMDLKSIKDAINAMRKVGTPEHLVESFQKEAMADLVEPARKSVNDLILKKLNEVTESKAFKENVELFHGATFSGYIEIDKEGKVTVREKTVVKRKRSRGGSSGKRPTLLVDGKSYASYASLCKAYDLDLNGDSGRRVWERAHAEDAKKYPAVAEVDSDNESK